MEETLDFANGFAHGCLDGVTFGGYSAYFGSFQPKTSFGVLGESAGTLAAFITPMGLASAEIKFCVKTVQLTSNAYKAEQTLLRSAQIQRSIANATVKTTRNPNNLVQLEKASVGLEVLAEAGTAAKEGATLSRGAENVNAGVNLNCKLNTLEYFQQSAVQTRTLPDGRIRYYDPERVAKTAGPTRGACNVLEFNPKTNNVRSWYECRDHSGNVNRVHPKTINGQDVSSPHYPPTASELKK